MADQVRVELTCPADATLEKRELERRETPRNAAHEYRFAHRLARRREMADVVVREIRCGLAKAEPARGAVKGRRDFQLDALRPHRVVIVFAVDREHVIPCRLPAT